MLYRLSHQGSHINSNTFWWFLYIFSIWYHACKWWQFYFPFFNLNAFYFFASLIAVTRASNTMLNKSGKSGCACLVPNLRGNAFSFSLLVWCWLWFCLNLYYVEICFLYTQFIERFYHKSLLKFVRVSCVFWDDGLIFILQFVTVVIISVYFWVLRHPRLSGVNSAWLWYAVVFVQSLSCVRNTRLLSPPLFPRVCSDSCPLSQGWHLILCLHLLLLPSIFPSIRVFSILSQHQGIFQGLGSLHHVPKILELHLSNQFLQLILMVYFL